MQGRGLLRGPLRGGVHQRCGTLLCGSTQVGARRPHVPHGEGAPPLHPRVTFPSRGKSPKARQGSTPGPPRGTLRSPCGSRNPLDRAFSHKNRPICHFGFVGKSVLFFPLVPSREHSVFSIRGAAGLPRGCRGPFYPQPIPLGHRAGESKGGPPPLCRRSRDQKVPGESLPTFFSQESRPGWRGGAPSW